MHSSRVTSGRGCGNKKLTIKDQQLLNQDISRHEFGFKITRIQAPNFRPFPYAAFNFLYFLACEMLDTKFQDCWSDEAWAWSFVNLCY